MPGGDYLSPHWHVDATNLFLLSSITMRSFIFTAVIGAAALAIRGVSGAILPSKATNLIFDQIVKRNAMADPTSLNAVLDSSSDDDCAWQYQDISGGQCPQLIRDLTIGTLGQLLEQCYHYTCNCKRDINEVEDPAELAERDIDTLSTGLQPREVIANCAWQYQDTSGGQCPQLINALHIGNLDQVLEGCYHYTCSCKRDVDEAESLANLAKREPIGTATSTPSRSRFPVANPSKRDISAEPELETSEVVAREAQPGM
ncbi:MAG: hypothetical protein Q9212_004326 [Teloschistes hypoglaucus]